MKSFLRISFLLIILLITGVSVQKSYAQISPVSCQSNSLYSTGKDSSDIGRFVIGNDTFGTVYSHLANPAAIDSYVFYSADTLKLYLDSTYNLQEAGIMYTIHDAAAKVTLFIDFDNSLTYDVPQELVWTATSTPYVNYILNGSFTVPGTAATNIPVMMRLILNNDTAANGASDSACGTYTSGETADFVVIFLDGSNLSVNKLQGTERSVQLYPNPCTSKFNLKLNNNKPISHLQLNVMSVTGQLIYSNAYKGLNKQFSIGIDLSTMPKGLYFVETIADGEKQISKVTLQ